MATNDGFQPDRPPIFLSEPAEETGQPDIGKAQDIAIISSRILKASIAAAAVTAIGIAVLSIDNPATLVANLTDWASDKPAVQPEADPPARAIQSIAIASTQDLTTTTTDTPTREEIAAAAEQHQEPAQQSQEPTQQSQVAEQGQAAQQSQAEVGQPITEALFKQFQAWADEEEARTKAAAAQPAPVRVTEEAPAQARKKHRRVRSVQNARAEIRAQRNHRAKAREEQDARGQVSPATDPRLPDPSVQNPQPPTFLQSLGLGN
ncbi:hypothetical protein [Bradyrhizobium sp. CB3481]|uniref:hypothetical protein n=1 Tax=Bradyrhizobium sp. CB3481 TaxID=3039158 RepID=UPI0024B1F0B3|nr:hypothetical protein [Bradyrhizobium sp. CB3481]WFU20207.1 hypothetical protein QA643_18670 [Bradyrhizobium sp. CB3481]